MSFVKHRNWYYLFSGILMILAVLALVFWRLKLGIDFTGGTLWEIDFQEQPAVSELRDVFVRQGVKDPILQQGQGSRVLARVRDLSESEHQAIIAEIRNKIGEFTELRFDSVGPIIGRELQQKAFKASLIAVAGIFLYVLIAFRKVERVTSVWKMSLATIIALIHDVVITIGVFSILGRFLNVEIGLPFVAAVLTIFGYSVNDTVVVFDRIRENAIKPTALKQNFNDLVDESLRQTVARSVITSLVVILSLLAIFLWGGESLKYFSLALLVGIGFGTYSSIFIASMLLTSLQKQKT